MKSTLNYYLILFVYLSLWTCQLIAGHLTHSLIILTDSYINLYKILNISLGVLHLRTQIKVHDHKDPLKASSVRLFGFNCTFKFKRLPILGSFVNGLFLAALLMSAAIEGIQTCFHVNHLQDSSNGAKSILLQHPVTYPAILIGFALVGLIMQWCSDIAHEICQEELSQFYDEYENQNQNQNQNQKDKSKRQDSLEKRTSQLERDFPIIIPLNDGKQSINKKFLPDDSNSSSSSKNGSQISLKSLKISPNLESNNFIDIKEISSSVTVQFSGSEQQQQQQQQQQVKKGFTFDIWMAIRYSASPLGLIICALIIYLINDELVTEIADASLAITVVILMFRASFPPMKSAGKVLLQSAPADVEPEELRAEIKALSNSILEVKEFHVWYLTLPEKKNNRIGSCKLILDSRGIKNQREIVELINKTKEIFLSKQIKCSTIQPLFFKESTNQPSKTSNANSTTCPNHGHHDHHHHHHH